MYASQLLEYGLKRLQDLRDESRISTIYAQQLGILPQLQLQQTVWIFGLTIDPTLWYIENHHMSGFSSRITSYEYRPCFFRLVSEVVILWAYTGQLSTEISVSAFQNCSMNGRTRASPLSIQAICLLTTSGMIPILTAILNVALQKGRPGLTFDAGFKIHRQNINKINAHVASERQELM